MNLALAHPGGASAARGQQDLMSGQFLTFALANRPYGVPLRQVAEITPHSTLNHIPHMPKGVEGLLDLRGAVLPVINLRTRLGIKGDVEHPPENIIVLDLESSRVGVLVDRVLSVVPSSQDTFRMASPLLGGPEGQWVSGFLIQTEGVVVLLDTEAITTSGSIKHHQGPALAKSIDRKLDEELRHLIDEAPPKEMADQERSRIIPQIEQAITHSEEETAKVIARIESMLTQTDTAFQGIMRLKQEAKLSALKDQEATIAEIERIGQRIQDAVFSTLNQLQFQDIARQKLERVLKYIQGMQRLVGSRFRDGGGRRG